MKKFVLGDPHGGLKAIVQVLDRAKFDYETDQLIVIGDVCDGWPDTPGCFEELFKIKNLIYIKGNHDEWTLKWMTGKFDTSHLSTNMEAQSWLMHGGKATKKAYLQDYDLLKPHTEFLKTKALPYYLDEENRLFVHAGFDSNLPLDKQSENMFLWDRELWTGMFRREEDLCKEYHEVFIGHTPTINYPDQGQDACKLPINRKNCWNVDTGAAFTGPLTVMNIETKEYFQSDIVRTLYPDDRGRNWKTYNQENNN